MMVIRERVLGWTRSIALAGFVQGSPECPRGYHPLLATLELIKTQELILVQEESFGDIYLMERRKKVKWPKARLDREER